MPVHLRLRVAWQFQDADPKNQLIINPCFRVNGVFTDAQALCDSLATSLKTWPVFVGWQGTQLTVTSYDIEGTKPVYPNGRSQVNPGVAQAPTGDPAQAVTLSFYSDVNAPRRRGRLYVPAMLATNTASELGSGTISSTVRNKIGTLVPIFANLGGANVDWIVWSGVDHAAHIVNNWWVDDSWDHIRSRKLKTTTRTVGTTSG
jgi:hypothetical protein